MADTHLGTTADNLTVTRTVPFASTANLPGTHLAAPAEIPPLSPPPLACANCATPLSGPYCFQCGQHVADYHRSVWRFVADFFDNTFCWDNKLFGTLVPLFKQPGFLTLEFMRGRRVRYVHPLRLFLFTSAVCLALLQYSHPEAIHVETNPGKAHKPHVNFDFNGGHPPRPTVPPSPAIAGPESPAPSVAGSPAADISSPAPSAAPSPAAKTDAKVKGKTPDDNDDDDEDLGAAINRALAEKKAKGKLTGTTVPDDLGETISRSVSDKIARAGGVKKLSKAISEGVQQRLSWVALALLPVFALFLRSVYWRNDSYYFAHLIFSLHYHTFLLLFWTAYTYAGMVAAYIPFGSFFGAFLPFALFLPPIYLFKALRATYGGGTKRTVAKVFVLGGMHLLAIVIGVSAVGAMAFFSATK